MRMFLVVALLSTAVPAQEPSPPTVTLVCQQNATEFRVTLQNISAGPTAAVIGSILANDKKYLPGKFALTVHRPDRADADYEYVDPTIPGVAGRVDPWLVMLPPKASYAITLPVHNFVGGREPFTSPADLRLRIATSPIEHVNGDMPALRLIHVWVGRVVSDWIHFPADCR
jgi:hypothetical protein